MKQFITPDVLANQVRMQRAAFRGTFIFVEGVLYPELRVVLPRLRPEREEYRLTCPTPKSDGMPATLDVSCFGSGPLSPADREVQRALESLPMLYRALGETLKWLHQTKLKHPEMGGLSDIYHMNRKVAGRAGVKLLEK